MNENIVSVTRHNPHTHESIILISFTVFSQPTGFIDKKPNVQNFKVEGEIYEIILEAKIISQKE